MRKKIPKSILLALNWKHPKLHLGVATYAKEAGWHLNASTEYSGTLPVDWMGDGVISQRGIPLIEKFLSTYKGVCVSVAETSLGPYVCDDRKAAGRIAARYFHSRGFRKIYYYCPHILPENDFRRIGLEDECNQLGCNVIDIHPPPPGATWSRQCLHLSKQIKQAELPIAVFAFEDIYAAEILDAALAANIRVPEEVSILGVNNDELICETQTVPLSSIDNNLVKVGYEAATLLDRIICGEAPADCAVMIAPESNVIIRQSTDTYAITHPGLLKALSFIKENFSRRISVPDIAKAAGMSESGLRQAFHQYLNHPPGEEIFRLRVEYACRMLAESDMKIEEIAEASGFGDRRNLYTAFLRSVPCSPSQYRKEAKSKNGPLPF